MLHKLMWAVRWLLRLGVGLAFTVLLVSVIVQVATRSFSSGSPVWTEELSRYALLYVAGFGAALSLWSGDLVNVDLFSERLPWKFPWLMRLISALSVVLFAVVLLPSAWFFTKIGMMQTSPTMGVKMSYVHGSMLVLLICLAIAAALRVIGMLCGVLDGKPENIAEEHI